jgi:hypothetical protein
MSQQSHDPEPEKITDAVGEMLTWKDSLTGLEWQYRSPGKMNWYEALEYAQSLTLNGTNDWRLPSATELETLLDRKTLLERIRPVMRKEVPFRDTLSYWSSTTFAPNTYSAWIVMFDGAYILSYYKTSAYHVRCVRGVETKPAFSSSL